MSELATHNWWNNERSRAVLYQVVLLLGVVGLVWFLVYNTLQNLESQHVSTGFGFLGREASFGISESSIAYSPADTYSRALWVGLLNTLKVSIIGIILCTILGLVVGLARLSSNWLVSRMAGAYIEAVRNVPVLLQLFLWYALITEGLPAARNALSVFDMIFLSNRGLKFPSPIWNEAAISVLLALLVAIAASFAVLFWAKRRLDKTGKAFPVFTTACALIVGLPLIVWFMAGADIEMSIPELKGFNFVGGYTITPEFFALLLGLVLYTGAFVAEIVRSGVLAVPRGQTEAAMALNLPKALVLRLVILPQSLRVAIPPLTSQYLNLTKNSTLAVAIGYPDLVSVGNTAINQTGQAVECVAIIMGAYLTISLTLSLFMNWFNARVALIGGR